MKFNRNLRNYIGPTIDNRFEKIKILRNMCDLDDRFILCNAF